MSLLHKCMAIAAVLLGMGMGVSHSAWGWPALLGSSSPERARIVVSQTVPQLDGSRLKMTLVEVNYGPGEASAPHSHPCPVIGYVVQGSLRTQVKGAPAVIYRAGESFYEPPNGVHLVSANASSTQPAKLLAYFLCDHDAPLSQPVGVDRKGAEQ